MSTLKRLGYVKVIPRKDFVTIFKGRTFAQRVVIGLAKFVGQVVVAAFLLWVLLVWWLG